MASKLVTQREKVSTIVEASMSRYGARASRSLAEKLRPYTDDGTPEVDFEAVFRLLGRALAGAREEMIAADEDRNVQMKDDIEPRRRRDAAADVVFQHVSDLREIAERLYGTGASEELLRVDGRTSRDPVVLHRQARRILRRLSSPNVVWPESRYDVQISLEGCAEKLQPHVEVLGAALRDLVAVRKRIGDRQMEKAEAMAAYDQTYLAVSQVAEAVLRFAGYEKVADQVRPSRRRSPQPRVPEEELEAAVAPVAEEEPAFAEPMVTEPPPSPSEAPPDDNPWILTRLS